MSSKVIDARAGDRWTRFRDGSGMVMRGLGGKVLLVGRHMLAPVEISESSISGELEDLPTPEAHAQLREWGYEVRGDVELNITESRVREIVDQVMKSALDKLDEHYDRRCDSLAVRMDNMDHALAHVRELTYEVGRTVDALTKAPPPPDVSPEPDWRGLLEELVEAWKQSYFSGTEAVDRVVNFNTSPALAAARTNGGGK